MDADPNSFNKNHPDIPVADMCELHGYAVGHARTKLPNGDYQSNVICAVFFELEGQTVRANLIAPYDQARRWGETLIEAADLVELRIENGVN